MKLKGTEGCLLPQCLSFSDSTAEFRPGISIKLQNEKFLAGVLPGRRFYHGSLQNQAGNIQDDLFQICRTHRLGIIICSGLVLASLLPVILDMLILKDLCS